MENKKDNLSPKDWNDFMPMWDQLFRKHLWRIKNSDKIAKTIVIKMKSSLLNSDFTKCVHWLNEANTYINQQP
jgi:hypothetical protein